MNVFRRMSQATAAVLVVTCMACGGGTALRDREELRGLPAADVADVIEHDADTDYPSTDEQVRNLQQFTKAWAACRDVYEVYDELVRTGELADEPVVRHAELDVGDTNEVTQGWISDLYEPMSDGDAEGTRLQLVDEQVCGFVPVAESGDRSQTIAEALGEQ